MGRCIPCFIESGAQAREFVGVEGGGAHTNTSNKALHKEAEMDTTRYPRKTSETSVKTFY